MQEETQKFFSPYAVWTRLPAPAPTPVSTESDSGSSASGSGSSSSSSASVSVVGGEGEVEKGGDNLMSVVGDAVDAYVRTYTSLLSSTVMSGHSESSTHSASNIAGESGSRSSSSGSVSGESGSGSGSIDEDFLRQYLTYRTVKDPAKRLLVGAFGGEWTERVLREVMFPMSESEGTAAVAVSAGETNTATTTVTASATATIKERASVVPPVVTFVTGNAKKLEEVDYILKTYETPFKLISEKVSVCTV